CERSPIPAPCSCPSLSSCWSLRAFFVRVTRSKQQPSTNRSRRITRTPPWRTKRTAASDRSRRSPEVARPAVFSGGPGHRQTASSRALGHAACLFPRPPFSGARASLPERIRTRPRPHRALARFPPPGSEDTGFHDALLRPFPQPLDAHAGGFADRAHGGLRARS